MVSIYYFLQDVADYEGFFCRFKLKRQATEERAGRATIILKCSQVANLIFQLPS